MSERPLTILNPGAVSNVPGRAGQPLNFDPLWFTFDRLQRLTVSEQRLRTIIREEIARALQGAETASGEDVLFEVVSE